jgi:hypothetical protein
MGEYLDRVPDKLKGHLREIARGSGLPQNEQTYETLAGAWLEKKASFEEQLRQFVMEEIGRVAADDERGMLVMTYSGSLLKVGPLVEGRRRVEYASIGLRTDVPETASADSGLAADAAVDAVVNLRSGPIRSSSPVYKIAVFTNPLGVVEQEERLSLMTRILAREFVAANGAIGRRGRG